MYGLPQAGILANNLPAQRLHNHGYYLVKHTPYVWRNISLILVVKDFGIVYAGKEHGDNLMSALRMYYKNITTDCKGKLYFVMTMNVIIPKGM